jgi:hypothetical protein
LNDIQQDKDVDWEHNEAVYRLDNQRRPIWRRVYGLSRHQAGRAIIQMANRRAKMVPDVSSVEIGLNSHRRTRGELWGPGSIVVPLCETAIAS